jgi:hypothetical protein
MKSSTKLPSAPSACGRTPLGPRRTSAAVTRTSPRSCLSVGGHVLTKQPPDVSVPRSELHFSVGPHSQPRTGAVVVLGDGRRNQPAVCLLPCSFRQWLMRGRYKFSSVLSRQAGSVIQPVVRPERDQGWTKTSLELGRVIICGSLIFNTLH